MPDLFTVYFTVGADVALGDYDVTLSKITFGYNFTDKDLAPDVTFQVHVVGTHSVVLDENATTPPDASDGAVNVTVLRTINAGEWSTLCLPFAMTEEQVAEAFGSGVQLADFAGYDLLDGGEGIRVNFNAASAIEANHPYVVRTQQSITSFRVEGVTVAPGDATINFGTSRRPKSFVGNYAAGTLVGNGCLFLSENKFWYSVGKTKIKAYRAYFDFYDLLPDFEDNYAESRVVFFLNDDVTTGIGKGVSFLEDDSRWVNLQGQRVNRPAKGIYLKKGKKVRIK